MRAKLFSEKLQLDTAETELGQNAKWYKVCHGGGGGSGRR